MKRAKRFLTKLFVVWSIILCGSCAFTLAFCTNSNENVVYAYSKVVENPNVDEKMFIAAVKADDKQTVKEMLGKGVDINAVYTIDGYVTTSLLAAINTKNRSMQQLLLENHADVTGFTYRGMGNYVHHSYFVEAARCYDYELMEYLLNWGANVNEIDGEGKNALIASITTGSHEPYGHSEDETRQILERQFDFLISKGINVNFVQHTALGGKRTALIAVADLKAFTGFDGIIYFSNNTRKVLIEKLLNAGADPNYKDSAGKTAVEYVLDTYVGHPADLESAKLLRSYMK